MNRKRHKRTETDRNLQKWTETDKNGQKWIEMDMGSKQKKTLQKIACDGTTFRGHQNL